MPAALGHSILKVVAYFDLFNYPVTKEEIHFFLDRTVNKHELYWDLEELTRHGYLFCERECYSLKNDPSLAEKRITANEKARILLATAHKLSRFLFAFPFVRGIGISGSLSKHFADEKADIDYFVITRRNKLWISRTILHAFKKLSFITGHQHWFCMNYFIDEDALCIEEKNIFTATELATLMPMCGNDTLKSFFRANDWSDHYFPNHFSKPAKHPTIAGQYKFKRLLESFFNNSWGDRLDDYFMRLTSRRWKEKEEKNKLNIKGNRMGLKTGKHYSKPKPAFFQEKILLRYNNKLNEYQKRWEALDLQKNQVFFLKEIMK
jgi:hypothetical protein